MDFAWPDARVAVEYDGLDWHSGPEAMRRDRRRQAALLDVGWVVIPIVFEDVRYRAWDFVKRHWDTMDGLYPKHGMRRLAEGVTGLATRELEADVQAFFAAKNPQFGGKVLAQYLEQLHVAVELRERETAALRTYLSAFA